ncbi:TPA: peptidylprolyl isomerase [Streptococcus agalactiae]|nr:peptidylprolyl isomerase [Streptococcus agalactiae]
MIDKTKVKIVASLGAVAVTSFIAVMGYSVGHQSATQMTQATIRKEAKALLQKQEKSDKQTKISTDGVKEFLTQYYTKEKLSENNERIKPYLTDAAFSEEVARQNEALNQVYKDYMIDYRFEDALIYIDQENNQAIAQVSYRVTYIADLEHKDEAKTTQTETQTLLLGYAKVGDKLLVNHMKSWNKTLEELENDPELSSNQEVNSAIPAISSSTTVRP